MKCYVSHPIAGKTEAQIFHLETLGQVWVRQHLGVDWEAVLPRTLQPHHHLGECPPGIPGGQDGGEHTWPCYLRGDIEWIAAEAESMLMMPGWQNSRGAIVEQFVALNCGIPVYYFD
jgi:hypothetical protein